MRPSRPLPQILPLHLCPPLALGVFTHLLAESAEGKFLLPYTEYPPRGLLSAQSGYWRSMKSLYGNERREGEKRNRRKAMRGKDGELPPEPHYLLHPWHPRHWAVKGRAHYLEDIRSSDRDRTRELGHNPVLHVSTRLVGETDRKTSRNDTFRKRSGALDSDKPGLKFWLY